MSVYTRNAAAFAAVKKFVNEHLTVTLETSICSYD